jgi:aspartate/methionine/tyrosine aminotransferase
LVEQQSTLLAPGECFEHENHVRLGFACDTDVLTAGLDRVGALLKELQKDAS